MAMATNTSTTAQAPTLTQIEAALSSLQAQQEGFLTGLVCCEHDLAMLIATAECPPGGGGRLFAIMGITVGASPFLSEGCVLTYYGKKPETWVAKELEYLNLFAKSVIDTA